MEGSTCACKAKETQSGLCDESPLLLVYSNPFSEQLPAQLHVRALPLIPINLSNAGLLLAPNSLLFIRFVYL